MNRKGLFGLLWDDGLSMFRGGIGVSQDERLRGRILWEICSTSFSAHSVGGDFNG